MVGDNIIHIFRGDAKTIRVFDIVDAEGKPYALQPGDTLTLTVRQVPDPDNYPALLEASSGSEYIYLSGEATSKLPAGKYSYDVQLTTAGGEPHTLIPDDPKLGRAVNWKNFWVEGETTRGIR